MGRRNMCNKATSKNNLEKECDVLMNITLFVLNEKTNHLLNRYLALPKIMPEIKETSGALTALYLIYKCSLIYDTLMISTILFSNLLN